MMIDWAHFTPWASLAGGILIGIAAALLVLLNGRVAGISGIVGGLLAPRRDDIAWRVAFLAGLLLSPLMMMSFANLPAPGSTRAWARWRWRGCWSAWEPATARAAPAGMGYAGWRACRRARWWPL